MSLTPGCPLGLGVLSRVVEEADLTLLPMQKEGSARLSSLRGQKAIVRTLSAPPPFLSLSLNTCLGLALLEMISLAFS